MCVVNMFFAVVGLSLRQRCGVYNIYNISSLAGLLFGCIGVKYVYISLPIYLYMYISLPTG